MSRHQLEPIRSRIRQARAVLGYRARCLRQRFDIRRQSINTLTELIENTPAVALPRQRSGTKGAWMQKKTKVARLEGLLNKCEIIIEKSFAKLETEDWKNIRPGDLLAFMVLAKDIVAAIHADETTNVSELDAFLSGPVVN